MDTNRLGRALLASGMVLSLTAAASLAQAQMQEHAGHDAAKQEHSEAGHGAHEHPKEAPAEAGHDHSKHDHAAAGHGGQDQAKGAQAESGHDHSKHDHAAAGHGEQDQAKGAQAEAGHDHGAHDHSKHDHSAGAAGKPVEPVSAADIDLRDQTLVDENGRKRKFVSDVIGDHIVVMDFVFTNCTNVCPVLSAVLAQVRHTLGDRVGKEVALVSVSVDPVRDTPQRLKSYAAKYGATEGWTWLTGPKTQLEDVLIGLGAYSVNFEDHPSMVLVGDARTGQWSRFFGFPSPKRIVEQVEVLQAARKAAASGS